MPCGVTPGTISSSDRECHPSPHPTGAAVPVAAPPRPGAVSTFLITTLTQWLSHRIIKNINKHLSSLSKQEHLEPELRVHRVPPSAHVAPRTKLSAVSYRGRRAVPTLTGGSRGWGSDTSQPPAVPGFGTSIRDPPGASPSHSSPPCRGQFTLRWSELAASGTEPCSVSLAAASFHRIPVAECSLRSVLPLFPNIGSHPFCRHKPQSFRSAGAFAAQCGSSPSPT